MKHFKILLLLSLVLCVQLSLAANGKRNKCPRNGALVKCSTEFQGVCAFFKEHRRDRSLSQKYSANGCIACMDSRVRYTVDGPCDGDKVFCDANVRPEACTKEYNPVCGYNSKCKGNNCGIPAGNKCMACANSEIEWYVQGECPDAPIDDEVVCDPKNRPEICTAIYQPVCATVRTCKGKVCTITTRTEGSGCTACGNRDVISYVPGECPPVATQCDPRNRPEFCDDIYDPVCATLKNCKGGSCTQTAGNACSACSDPNVISHVPGECPIVPTQCDPRNRPQACIEIYQPVCATLEVCNGDSCTQTAGNACIACSDPNVLSHVPGECPIVVTQCDPNNRPEFCTDIYQPVCATIEQCSRNGCSTRTRTIANGCDACATRNVVSHVPGECPV